MPTAREAPDLIREMATPTLLNVSCKKLLFLWEIVTHAGYGTL